MKVKFYYRELIGTGERQPINFDATHAQQANRRIRKPTDFIEGVGINRDAALELVNSWNTSNKYKYFIPSF